MSHCPIKGCQNDRSRKNKMGTEKISFFHFPKTEISKEWLKLCGNKNINLKNARVCSIHFLESAFKEKTWVQQQLPNSLRGTLRLKDDAVPTEYLVPNTSDESNESALPIESLDVMKLQEFINTDSESTTTKMNTPLLEGDSQLSNSLQHENIENRDSFVVHQTMNTNVGSTTSTTQDSIPAENHQRANQLTNFTLVKQNQIMWQKLEAVSKANERLNKANKKLMQKLIMANKMLGVKERRILKFDYKATRYKKILERVFTPGQVKMLTNENQTKTKWCAEDISAAKSLQNISPKAYDFMRTTMRIPLPALSTLRIWAQKSGVEQCVSDTGKNYRNRKNVKVETKNSQ